MNDLARGSLLAPATLCLAILFLALSSLVAASVSVPSGPWYSHYAKFLGDNLYLAYVTRSLRVALYTTVLAVIIGYAIAYVMGHVSAATRRLIVMVLILQFFSVNITRIYSIILLLGNNGLMNRSLMAVGAIDAPIRLLYHEFGVVIGLVNAALPFAVFTISGVLARIPPSLREAAQTLGAWRGQTFWRVVFPLSLPGVGASVTIVFLYSFGAFATPLLLGGGFVDMISVFSYEQAINFSNYGFAAAGAVVSSLLALVLVGVFTKLLSGRTRFA